MAQDGEVAQLSLQDVLEGKLKKVKLGDARIITFIDVP